MLQDLPTEGFAYSLLGAYRSALYERYGWAPVEEELVRAELRPSEPGSVTIAPFTDADLPEVMDLYEETNAERPGPTIRSPQHWRGQLEWPEEDRDGFLLARKEDAALAGYVRSRAGRDDVAEVLELGLRAGDVEAGRALLSAVARRCGHWIRVNLPPSLRTLLRPDQTQITKGTGLMGRAIGLEAVAAALEPAWLECVRASGTRGGSFRLSMHAGAAEVWVSPSGLRVDRQGTKEAAPSLDEGAFAHLLFRGFGGGAGRRIGVDQDPSLLRVLFPEQDFVVWRADAF